MGTITLKIEITSEEAEAYAQTLKRTGYSDYIANAKSEIQAVRAHRAGLKIRQALSDAGFDAR